MGQDGHCPCGRARVPITRAPGRHMDRHVPVCQRRASVDRAPRRTSRPGHRDCARRPGRTGCMRERDPSLPSQRAGVPGPGRALDGAPVPWEARRGCKEKGWGAPGRGGSVGSRGCAPVRDHMAAGTGAVLLVLPLSVVVPASSDDRRPRARRPLTRPRSGAFDPPPPNPLRPHLHLHLHPHLVPLHPRSLVPQPDLLLTRASE